MDLKLDGKTALITGSSKGIGEAIARGLACERATVIVHGRDLRSCVTFSDRRAGIGPLHRLTTARCHHLVIKIPFVVPIGNFRVKLGEYHWYRSVHARRPAKPR